MSVLDTTPTPAMPVADRTAQQIKQQARMTYHQLVNAFNTGAQMFWKNGQATPVEIAAALGKDGKEIFELHGKIGALLATIKPEAIASGVAVVGQFSYNNDGSVTITPPAAS